MSHAHGGHADVLAIVHEPPQEPKAGPLLWGVLGLVLLVGLGLVAYIGIVFLRADHSSENAYPGTWDARVAPYVAIVEKKRGLAFEHPVYVDFLPEAEFKKQVTSDEDRLTDEQREEIVSSTTLLRAVGLIDSDDDLFENLNSQSVSSIVGFYSFVDKRIRIRGTELTPAVQSTLVHELTHALQDQHFDLETRYKLLDRRDDDAATTGFRSVVEGDARRIETAWLNSLKKKQQKALRRDQSSQYKKYEKQSRDIPKVLGNAGAAPYTFGEAMVSLAVKRSGKLAANQLFVKPPSTDEHLVDPWTFLEDDDAPISVRTPELRKGETRVGEGTFGAISWMFTLAERRPPVETLDATDGWGGDAYVAFTRGGKDCVRVNYRADSAQDLAQMQSSLRAWAAAGPKSAAEVRTTGKMLVFESCDPGRALSPSKAGADDVLNLAVARGALSVDLAFAGDMGRCAADRLVHAFTLAELNDPAMSDEAEAVAAPCLAKH